MGWFGFGKNDNGSINADMGKDSWGENANTADFSSIWKGAQKGIDNTFDAAMLTALQQRQKGDEYQAKQLQQIKKRKEDEAVAGAIYSNMRKKEAARVRRLQQERLQMELPEVFNKYELRLQLNNETLNSHIEEIENRLVKVEVLEQMFNEYSSKLKLTDNEKLTLLSRSREQMLKDGLDKFIINRIESKTMFKDKDES